MKLKTFFLLLLLGCCMAMSAQSISVKSFQALPMDMTALSLEGKRIDQNGEVAALIKIVTTETGFTFEAGALGIVDSKQEIGEVWAWVPKLSKKITIKHQQLGVLRDYRYPIEIEAGRTYEMVLTTAKIETIVKEEVRQQYLIFELEPKNATLEVNDQLWSVDAEGTALQFVDFGTYTYRVRAANYETDAGVVTVDDPNNPITIKVNLNSNFAEVTFKVDADAEIWVNNDKKGVRTWTGSLGKGTYKIECKQEGCETSMTSREITAEMNGQTITLPAPRPIYGSLSVESTPNYATIYLDGKAIGETPKFMKEILAGEHEVKLVKEGCFDYVGTVTISKGEQQQIKALLEKDGTAPVAINNLQEEQISVNLPTTVNSEKPVAKSGIRKKGFVMRPEVGCVYGSDYINTGVTAHLSMGYQFGSHFYLGGICGYDGFYYRHYNHDNYNGKERNLYFILGLDSRWYILNRNWTPIVGVEIGLSWFSCYNYDYITFKSSSYLDYYSDTKLKVGYAYKNWELTLGAVILSPYVANMIVDVSYRFSFSSSKAGK